MMRCERVGRLGVVAAVMLVGAVCGVAQEEGGALPESKAATLAVTTGHEAYRFDEAIPVTLTATHVGKRMGSVQLTDARPMVAYRIEVIGPDGEAVPLTREGQRAKEAPITRRTTKKLASGDKHAVEIPMLNRWYDMTMKGNYVIRVHTTVVDQRTGKKARLVGPAVRVTVHEHATREAWKKAGGASADGPGEAETVAAKGDEQAGGSPFYGFVAMDIDGKPVALNDYRGKVVLVVNVASRCGFTKQYAGLQKLYDEKKGDGLVILGFPCNQFGKQERGTEAEIKAFCEKKFGVTFPMFSKIEVNGDGAHPLYKWLTDEEKQGKRGGKVRWNFTKFLVDREGQAVGRFDSRVKPDDEKLVAAIDAALGE